MSQQRGECELILRLPQVDQTVRVQVETASTVSHFPVTRSVTYHDNAFRLLLREKGIIILDTFSQHD